MNMRGRLTTLWYAVRKMHFTQFLRLVDAFLLGDLPDLDWVGKEGMLYRDALLPQLLIAIESFRMQTPAVAKLPVVKVRIEKFRV